MTLWRRSRVAAGGWLGAAAPLAAYTAAAVACTWPLAMEMSTTLGAPVGPGDPFLNLWILGWGMQAVWTDPTALLTGRVFDANIFHPTAGTLAYSDHLLLQAATLAPLYGVTKNVVLCYNVLLLASLVLSALAMHVFVREVTLVARGRVPRRPGVGLRILSLRALDPFAAPGAVFPAADVPLSASGDCGWAKTRRDPPGRNDRSAGSRIRLLRRHRRTGPRRRVGRVALEQRTSSDQIDRGVCWPVRCSSRRSSPAPWR